MNQFNEIKRLQQLAGINEVKVIPTRSKHSLNRSEMIKKMWEYDDIGFWEDAGFHRTNINAFGSQFDNYQLIANYFDTVGDINSIDKNKLLYIDGKDVTSELKQYLQDSGQINEIRVVNPNRLQVDMFKVEDIDYPIIILNNDDKQYEGMLRGDEILFNTSWGEDDMDIVEDELKNIFNSKNIPYQIQNDNEGIWVVIDKKRVEIINK
jgi:hypothetical protein